ncbi:MAG: fibrobacter succinogenes major paralogous domain-containing protein, partial [Chitinispirillia bacterium]|nr:fibrobacter succinogenes major paralogous domain-containing protein [Chitinispirillia bacterium]MCL2267620.1 fibrobacter succinogenes major paralogous domain-containing protein [Chitinispirillia bacterium]
SGAAKEMSKAEVRVITDEIRREAVNNLPRNRYSVMTSETVQSMGSAVLEECAEENCVITLGSKIGADYIVRGIISKYRNNFTLTVEMYETEYGMLVATASPVRTANLDELLEKSAPACAAMYKKFMETSLPAGVQQAVTVTSSVNSDDTFTDPRDGKTYRTVSIGNQTWMAENLNYQTGKSSCYKNKDDNCQKYGRLYDWNTAMSACPAGWRLPSNSDWDDLVQTAGGYKIAGRKLKSETGWRKGNGTDDFSFSALPGGYRWSGGSFHDVGDYGYWWSATENDASYAWYRGIYNDYDLVLKNYNYKAYLFSARCLRDW